MTSPFTTAPTLWRTGENQIARRNSKSRGQIADGFISPTKQMTNIAARWMVFAVNL
ncbi:hypothetical protein KCP74_14515 [Salmonella enterica subsp. enterica]|nr:hypothetical protein KCP74_14515 [Salmonella enterica subsp. enterica]